jgi:hypothetical protein
MSAAVKELASSSVKVTSIMMPTSQQEFTDLQKSFADARIDMNKFQQLYGPIAGYIQTIISMNSVPFPPTSKYTGNNRAKDLLAAILDLKKAVSPLQNNTAVKVPPAPPPSWQPPPGMPPPVKSISELLSKLDDIIKLLGGDPAAGSATNSAELEKKKASAATAATAAAAELEKKTAAAAAELQKKTASAATAAAAAAAEQQRISGILSSVQSTLTGVKTAIQGGGSASGASANPVKAAVDALNSVKLSNIPKEVLTNSAKGTVNEAIQMLKQLKEHQSFVTTRVNAAVKALNAAATKKGGSRKNNFTRTRKGGSYRKRTRSRSRR